MRKSVWYIMALLFIPVSVFGKVGSLEKVMHEVMEKHTGVAVFIEGASGVVATTDSGMANKRLTPCSTFKIWNTLIGVECGMISSADEHFYTWDGKKRFLAAWNRDQTVKEAFRVSCVPAFQGLATRIGMQNMKRWIDTISYGDRNISSGIADFWLPIEGKTSIMISPVEQASLIMKLVSKKLPFSGKATAVLKEVMLSKETPNGTLYGKTGTDMNIGGDPKRNLGWYVGYVTSKGSVYSFACVVYGENIYGSSAMAIVESILTTATML